MQPNIVAIFVTWDDLKSKTAMDMAILAGSGVLSGFVHNEGSLVVPARNSALFMATKQYPNATHYLFIDNDVTGVTPELVDAMVRRNVPIISPLTNKRQPPYQPHLRYKEDIEKALEQLERPNHERGIIEVGGCSLGCCLIHRDVIHETAEVWEDADGKKFVNWFCSERRPRDTIFKEADELKEKLIKKFKKNTQSTQNMVEECVREALTLGLHSHTHGELVGEDYWFFNKAKSCGFPCYVDMQHHVGHIGNFIYTIDDWFARDKQANNEEVNEKDPRLTAWNVKNKKYIDVPGGNMILP